RPRVFVNSMSDWLDNEVPIAWLAYLLETLHLCPHLDFQLLTKRPENWEERLNVALGECLFKPASESAPLRDFIAAWLNGTPPANVWIG
ncbi:phage Gp37/Gp68 family protein, partial [Lactococcus petauri]|uniref:phage Gp37/Gp68 family protein n=1 Tax=Lactococcus petauri TaxID=1940789 RepID=UPI0021F1277E